MKRAILFLFLASTLLSALHTIAANRLYVTTNHGFLIQRSSTEKGVPAYVPTTSLSLKVVRPYVSYKYPATVQMKVVDNTGNIVREKEYSVNTLGQVDAIPAADMEGGDVYITANLELPETYTDNQYVCVFQDEFDGESHSQPNSALWERAAHNNNSAWNRFISTSDKVVYLEDGDLVTRCIPCAAEDMEGNKDHITGNYRDWMSGAVDTRGLFSFKYGRIDVRALTNPFNGSFPAIWMLPDDQSAGWPYYGEIDIWEMINTQNKAFGTIHAQKESQYGKNTTCNYTNLYHVYTLEWTATQMKWSIDGTAYSTLDKSIYTADQIANGYWPFDKNYYIILNQSVGNGSWALAPVAGHEYETRFDFVRVYQTPAQNPLVEVATPVTSGPHSNHAVYDLQGRRLYKSGGRGLSIENAQKVLR